jgi:hypothetical protein
LEATASTLTSASSSFAAQSASLSTRLTTDETNITTLTLASSSFAAQSASLSTRLTTDETNFSTTSGSLSTRVTNLEATSSTVSSSFASTSGSIAGRVTLIEGQYATTGSNTFTGPQFINQASNAISFTSTASLYTDGGLRVAKDSFVSGTAYFNNITVYGTSSIQYITSSQVNIGSNVITVNTDTPAIRFGGISVFDSGSTQLTGSLFWDSEKNHWIYSNPSGSSYNSAMLMNGPRNTGSLGTEQGTTNNALMKGQGGDHITSSQMIDDGTTVQIPGNLQVTGSIVGSSTVTATNGLLIGNGGATATTNYLPKFTGASTIGNSIITDNGSQVVINTATSTTSQFRIENTSFAAGQTMGIDFTVGGGSKQAYVRAVVNNGTTAATDLVFGTASGGNNAATVLTLASTGAATFSSSVSGTSIRSSAVGSFGFNTANNGEFQIYATALDGMVMAGRGSTNDMVITNKSGSDVFRIPTGTTNVTFLGALTGTSATFSSNLQAQSLTINTADQYLQMNGYNGAITQFISNAGYSSAYNGLQITSNSNNANSLPAWSIDLGGYDSNFSNNDQFNLGRKASGGSWIKFLTIANTGAATFSNTLTVTNQLSTYGVYSTSNYRADGGYYEAVPNYATYSAWNLRVGAQAADACYYITGGGKNILTTEGYNNPYTVKLYSNDIVTLTMTNGAATFSSSVTAGAATFSGLLILNGASGGTNTYNELNRNVITTESMFVWKTAGAAKWYLGQRSKLSQDGFSLFSVAAGEDVLYFSPSGAATFLSSITAGADITAYSDAKLKENVVTIDNALEKVKALRGVFYNRIDTEDKSRKIGVIAQEVQEVLPEVVSTNNDTLGVAYGNMVGVLIEAIKEQQTQIEELKILIHGLTK